MERVAVVTAATPQESETDRGNARDVKEPLHVVEAVVQVVVVVLGGQYPPCLLEWSRLDRQV